MDFTKKLDGTGRTLDIRYNLTQDSDGNVFADVSMNPPDELEHPLVLENAKLAEQLWNLGRPNNTPVFPINNIQSNYIGNLIATS